MYMMVTFMDYIVNNYKKKKFKAFSVDLCCGHCRVPYCGVWTGFNRGATLDQWNAGKLAGRVWNLTVQSIDCAKLWVTSSQCIL